MMFSFWVFPFSLLIPFFIISLLIRFFAGMQNSRITQGRSVRGLFPTRSALGPDPSDEEFEVYLYRLAAKLNGRLTTARIVVDSGLPMKEVQQRMDRLVDNVHIRMEVDDQGLIYYDFPEFKN